MKLRIILTPGVFLFFLLVGSAAFAQEKYTFSSQNNIGLLEGSSGSAFQLQTINGIRSGQWFAGIGTGLDYYHLRSIPVFLSVNRYLTPKNRSPFLSLDGGLNYAWAKRERSRENDIISSRFYPSLYWSGGLGYKTGLKNKQDALLVSLGYSYKEINEKQEKTVFCINPPCPPQVETYHFGLKRVSIRIGWQF